MPTNLGKLKLYLTKLSQKLPWKKGIIFFSVIFLGVWLSWTPNGLLGKADAIGYAVCHRIDLRSFHLGDRQIPLCARCTGQYLGAMISLLFLAVFRPRRTASPPWAIVAIMLLFAGFYALDGFNSYIHLIPQLSRFYLYQPSNTLRLVSGTGLGLGMGMLVFPAFNSTIWKKVDHRPVVQGTQDFMAILIIAALVDFLVLTENPLFLYPLAIVSASGVLVLLTLIYTMIVVIVSKNENAYENFRQLTLMVIIGFIIALVQISVLDVLRFILTGTWDGFHFV